MVHALGRGLLVSDFNELSVGMILDYIARYDRIHESKEDCTEQTMIASQSEFNIF